jgi:hypothetical protein
LKIFRTSTLRDEALICSDAERRLNDLLFPNAGIFASRNLSVS